MDSAPQPTPRRARMGEIAWVAGVLVVLECVVFWDYFAGAAAPPWDFFGSYNTDAYAWWSNGSFFEPAEWIPHAWGGYPAAASIQNSAWYLPVGLVSLITPFTIHASAALAALHYGFGALGVYVLGRSFGLGRVSSTFGLTAFFFVSGFYAQAEHVDIARGYAWLPWILLCTSSKWQWNRWWGIPLATLALWQAALGTYPGMLVAAAYVVGAWVIVQQAVTRLPLRQHLIPLAVSGLTAVMLLAPKYVPILLLDSGSGASATDSSVFGWGILATTFLPYGSNPTLPNDIAIRSFFLPATCFVLAMLAGVKSHFTRATTAMLVTAVVIGLPNLPLRSLVDQLPGLGLSRFRMSDFRAFMLIAVCLLAMAALQRLLNRELSFATFAKGDSRCIAAWLILLPLAILTLACTTDFQPNDWTPPLVLTVGVCVTIWLATLPLPAALRGYRLDTRPAAAILVALTILSGVLSAYATPQTWRAPRVIAEEASFGDSVEDLIAQDVADEPLIQRPARISAPDAAEADDLMASTWNAGYYTGDDSIGGYVNLKRSETFEQLRDALLDPARSADVNAAYSAPGIVVELDEGRLPSVPEVDLCVASGDCGDGLTVEPVGYEVGNLKYLVRSEDDVTIALNEAYYLGWRVSACPSQPGDCQELQAVRGPAGSLSVALPAGAWTLEAEYVPPGSEKAWIAFWLGAATLAATAAHVAFRTARLRSRERT